MSKKEHVFLSRDSEGWLDEGKIARYEEMVTHRLRSILPYEKSEEIISKKLLISVGVPETQEELDDLLDKSLAEKIYLNGGYFEVVPEKVNPNTTFYGMAETVIKLIPEDIFNITDFDKNTRFAYMTSFFDCKIVADDDIYIDTDRMTFEDLFINCELGENIHGHSQSQYFNKKTKECEKIIDKMNDFFKSYSIDSVFRRFKGKLDSIKTYNLHYGDDIPAKKIKNARKGFKHLKPDESIFLILDQSLINSGKSGFVITDKAIHFKDRGLFTNDVIFLDDIEEVNLTERSFGMKSVSVKSKSKGEFYEVLSLNERNNLPVLEAVCEICKLLPFTYFTLDNEESLSA